MTLLTILFTLFLELDNPLALLGLLQKKEVQLHFSNGLKLYIRNYKDLVAIQSIIFTDQYQILDFDEAPKTILDYGASIGTFACWSAQVYPETDITSVAHTKEEFAYLKKNKGVNRVRNITIEKEQELNKLINSNVDLLKIDTSKSAIEIIKSIKKSKFNKVRKIILLYTISTSHNQEKDHIKLLKENGFKVQQQANPYNKNEGILIAKK